MLTIVALHALAGPLDLRCPEGTTLRQRERHAWCLESIDGYRHHHRLGPEVWLASDGRVTMRREHGPYGCALEERYGPGGELVWRADTTGCTRGEASWYDADGTPRVRGTVWLDQVGPEKLRGTWDVDGEQVDVGSPDPRRPAWRTLWSIQHAALGPFATPAAHSRVFQDPGDVHVIEVDTVAHGGRAWRRQVEDDDVRVYMDNLFVEGLLEPTAAVRPIDDDRWFGVGIAGSPASSSEGRFFHLLDELGATIPSADDATYQDWQDYSLRWGTWVRLRWQTQPDRDPASEAASVAFVERLQAAFSTWLQRRFGPMSTL
ncbi:MAG: hypothetical protein KC656_04545, partial [Myxococcales bacterium]|nr:hypothetical protein [Myxococcales bacterium]